MDGGDEIGTGRGGATLFLAMAHGADALARVAEGAGWRVVSVVGADPATFEASGAAVAVVGDLEGVRALALPCERAGAALVALVPVGEAEAAHGAGATHHLATPVDDAAFARALLFAARHAERAGRRKLPGRRRDDPAAPRSADDAGTRWVAGRLAEGRPVLVARVALQGFDLVNGAHGRAAGDLILDEAAARLEREAGRLFGGAAIVSRAAGPEFMVAGDATASSPDAFAARVSAAMAEPFGRARVGARLGVALAEPGESAAAAVRRAGEALTTDDDDGAGTDELAIDLHHALLGDAIAVLFQPQVEIATGRIVGAEALARWAHPRLGAVGAEALFAAAERAGLGLALSEHVQRLALEGAARWPAALAGVRLSINVTAEDLGSPDFAGRFLNRVAASGFQAGRLTAEVTETTLIADLDRAGALLGQLRAAGCRTAIDDFGTGYSSLAYLSALPLDYLKLDRALVHGVERDGRERLVARGVLRIARSLGLIAIAEGVETIAQRDLLAAEGCELYQGFLCAGAVDAGTLAGLIAS